MNSLCPYTGSELKEKMSSRLYAQHRIVQGHHLPRAIRRSVRRSYSSMRDVDYSEYINVKSGMNLRGCDSGTGHYPCGIVPCPVYREIPN